MIYLNKPAVFIISQINGNLDSFQRSETENNVMMDEGGQSGSAVGRMLFSSLGLLTEAEMFDDGVDVRKQNGCCVDGTK